MKIRKKLFQIWKKVFPFVSLLSLTSDNGEYHTNCRHSKIKGVESKKRVEWLPFFCSLGLVGLLVSTYKFRVLRRANEKQMALDRRAKASESNGCEGEPGPGWNSIQQ